MNTICSLLNKIRRRRTTNMENVTEQTQLIKIEREEDRKMMEHIESNTQRIERLEQRSEAFEIRTKIQPESVVRSETLPQSIQCTNEPDGLQRSMQPRFSDHSFIVRGVIEGRDIREIHQLDYKIGRLISSGGFGKVHEGQWENKKVAVKCITVTDRGTAVIEKEIKFNGLVKHRNIVVLHAYCKYKPGTSSNICFDLIMDFIKGFTLHDALFVYKVRNLKISKGRLLTAQKISAALAHMHSKGCTHSDIKTDNILIREQDNEPFICDLGLAHGVTHSAVTEISSGRRQRAPVWFPPESLFKGEHPVASYKADVWAMGRVLLEIFTGRPVWEGLSQGSDEVPPDSIIIGHLMGCHYDENHDVTPHTIKYVEDKSVRDLIRRCFSAKPNERPSAENLADQFGEVLNKKETSSSNRPTVSKDDYVDMK